MANDTNIKIMKGIYFFIYFWDDAFFDVYEKYLEHVFNNLSGKPIEELLPYSKEIRKMK